MILSKLRTLREWHSRLDGLRSLRAAIELYRTGRVGGDLGTANLRTLTLRDGRTHLHLRPGTSDFTVFLELFVLEEYAAAPRLVAGDVRWIVDLGTNVGLSLAYFRRLWPGAKFIGVEPEVTNLDVARRNHANAIESGEGFLHRAVAGGEPGYAWLGKGGFGGGNELRRVDELAAAVAGEQVPVITVPDLMTQHGVETIDLLKCDIEGGEASVFRDCASWIGRVRHLVVETHGELDATWLMSRLNAGGQRFEQLQVERKHADALSLVWARRLA
jgi:FkbM family methyltransferase